MNNQVGRMTRHFDDYEVEKVLYYLEAKGIEYTHRILKRPIYRDRPHSVTAYATVEQQFELNLLYESLRKREL